MGLRDDISTLEARFGSDSGTQDDGHALALAIAEMIGRKGAKRLVWAYFDDLALVLEKLGRYDELIEAAGGVDPATIGVWDCQAAVGDWLEMQQK